MASIARSASQSLRAASRRAPSALAKAAVKPAQTASYSLLARAAAVKAAQRVPVQVSHSRKLSKRESTSNEFSRVLAV